MDLNQKVFGNKTVEDLVKEVYNKQKDQDKKISEAITRVSEMVTNPGDAIILVPLLKGFFDSSLKNDETLFKMIQIFQKAAEANSKRDSSEASDSVLTQKDIDQLFSDIVTTAKEDDKLIG
jgi:hypothetical protein